MPADPNAVDADLLLERCRPALASLVRDLAERVLDPGVAAALRREHAAEVAARRTADPYDVWTDFRITQIAAAWLLSLLFVRTLEDRKLVPSRLGQSADHRDQLRSLAPYLGDRDYLLLVFRELTRHRAVAAVFDPAHNPVWTLGPSDEAAEALLAFCRRDDGLGSFDLSGDTRFLGDVYERLDEGVQKRFALLQTPDFVEEFILDRTLTPALAERGVDGLSFIDPTCGSGHFVLGGYRRLVDAWAQAEPTAGQEVWAWRALGQVFGADINPYAVAIARFRLVLAYLEAAGAKDLDAARDLRLNLAVADSLLPVEGAPQQSLAGFATDAESREGWNVNPYAAAQSADAQRVLGGRRFDVVVGNPPYITVKDAVLNQAYRDMYETAYNQYQLVAPFMERFAQLSTDGGFVGAIIGNGFMKREFGKVLVERFFAAVDLSLIVDTSGAYVPGHGTPTVMVFFRHRQPTMPHIDAVMGKRGEPETPEVPANGVVWRSICENWSSVGFDDDYISVERHKRSLFCTHPWTLRGGGAIDLKLRLDSGSRSTLDDVCVAMGRTNVMGHDDVFVFPNAQMVARRHPKLNSVPLVLGENVRDWAVQEPPRCVFPYHSVGGDPVAPDAPGVQVHFWRFRRLLQSRTVFKKTLAQRGQQWFEHLEYYRNKLKTPRSIPFAFVSTHNHFVLDRGGKVFKQSAPVIKLPPDATEEDHLALLGYLNSSTACFWMKMVSYDKGGQGINQGFKPVRWRRDYEFDVTKTRRMPIPDGLDATVVNLARAADAEAQHKAKWTANEVLETGGFQDSDGLRTLLAEARRQSDHHFLRLVALQEELDWAVYETVGLAVGVNIRDSEDIVGVLPSARPCERILIQEAHAGDFDATEWFRLHGWKQANLTRDADAVAEARLHLISQNLTLRLLEGPEFKRRWYKPDYAAEEAKALRKWVLTTLETHLSTQPDPRPSTTRQLARALQRDPKVRAVAEVLTDTTDPDLEALFTDLVKSDAVPYLAAWRYKPSGLKKHRAWQKTWAAQRAEDAWEAGDKQGPRPKVPLPPKYGSGDFRRPEYWRLRGKLDVPKERFVVYPGLATEDDPTPTLGWAGWDHADRMAALGELYEQHKTEPDRATPLLAGMVELLPWVQQWHGDDMRYNTPLGPMWAQHIEGERVRLGLSEDDLSTWAPPKKTRGRRSGGGSGRTRQPRTPLPEPHTVAAALDALHADSDSVTRTALAEHLGLTSAQTGKAVKPLLDAGSWAVVKKRPITYARGTES